MTGYLPRIAEIFEAIDKAYLEAQRVYGFGCEGCADNCCVTKFHHHTLIEEMYLSEGFKRLGENKKKNIITSAENVVQVHNTSAEDVRVMCPVNEDGRCVLYEHRPMICRIHGVPYEVFKKDMTVEYGMGCYRFITEKGKDPKGFKINRTRHYIELAMLEKEIRERQNFTGRYKKTTAEMILSIAKASS